MSRPAIFAQWEATLKSFLSLEDAVIGPAWQLNFSLCPLQFPSLFHRHWSQQTYCKVNSVSDSASQKPYLWHRPKGVFSNTWMMREQGLFSSSLTLLQSCKPEATLIHIFTMERKPQDKHNTSRWSRTEGNGEIMREWGREGGKERVRERTSERVRTRLMWQLHCKTWILPSLYQ